MNALLHSPSTAASPYQYNLAYQDASGVIPAQDYTVQASSLATLHDRFFQAGKAQGAYFRLGFYPWEGGYFTTIYPQALPYQRTVYASGDPAALWAAQYFQSYADPVGWPVGGPGAVRGRADGTHGLERRPRCTRAPT